MNLTIPGMVSFQYGWGHVKEQLTSLSRCRVQRFSAYVSAVLV